jgi:hypothetical protein
MEAIETFNEKIAEAKAALIAEEADLRAEDKIRRAELKAKLAAIRKLLGRKPKTADASVTG